MHPATLSRWRHALSAAAALLISTGALRAQDPGPPPDAAALKKQIEDLMRQNAETLRKLEEVQKRLAELEAAAKAPPAPPPSTPRPAPPPPAQTPQEALDAALTAPPSQPGAGAPIPSKGGELFSFKSGSATLRLMDISLVMDAAAGWSTEPDSSIQTLQAGDHDPRKRGFTLQAAEIGLAGAVDPYFYAQANINYNITPEGDSNVELEEAFATTTSLPWGLQVKAGQYFTEFGLMNPTHPHTWDWMDQPVVLSRLFGGDGMRAPGARVAWLTPLPWFSQFILGAQNGDGETMVSFRAGEDIFAERAIGGRGFVGHDVAALGDLVISGRWENFFELSKETSLKIGASFAVGPNATGPTGKTQIYGADVKFRWRPSSNERGWPFVVWQTEIIGRTYDADSFTDSSSTTFPAATLHDWGLYTQVLYGFTSGWAAGLRYEWATGDGDSIGGRDADPFRDDRTRLSPLLVWQLSEFSRLRVQYNHDWADHLDKGHADSLYIGIEVLFGAHPAHTY